MAFRAGRPLTAKDLFDARMRLTPLAKSRGDEYSSMREEARRTGAQFANGDETGPPVRRRLMDVSS